MATMYSAAVEVISKETIKPTTPTPSQLKNFNLSLLDQCFPLYYYVPIILFYPATAANSTGSSNHHDDLDLLKSSLSKTLVHFYPMAGRMIDNILVDCHDQGINFYKVKIRGKMCEFMSQPDVPLSQLLPSEVVSASVPKEALVIVQVNMFDCGGTAICSSVSHKIADAATMSTFIRSWASTTKTSRSGGSTAAVTDQKLIPSFDSASLFPPSERLTSPSGMSEIPFSSTPEDTEDDKTVSKRFVFDFAKITSVREKLQVLMHDNYKSRRQTRVEVVTSLIWKSVMKSTPAGFLPVVHHAVNLRKKMDPPLQDVSFGNLSVTVSAFLPATTTTTTNAVNKTINSTSSESQVVLHELHDFIAQMRSEIDKVKGDKGSLEKVIQNFASGHDASIKKINDVEVINFWISSWCRMGLYEIDFGWGKPIWVTVDPNIKPNKNCFFMNDTKCGEGIEVWASFLEDDMAKFELHLSEILELI
uniref:Salutaridinol 7-O-acetyltransferase n=1 Tax=Papaver somniferum TaxID=3469 RepID=SALAT_PAPSO|nr:RecName: Full=Salutaridinol 7-O-acetyltransferase; Short=salAT [Papaver somniferum]AAK73661.1 salutaridinol 7-O-acetyltransferase [Papaver somniferum]AKJ85665.1 SAT salutaridinol 7-O-acetyltransferase [synthetic construct]